MIPVRPAKIIGIGRNYLEHARELGNEVPTVPILFFKPPTSLIGPGEPILLPRVSRERLFILPPPGVTLEASASPRWHVPDLSVLLYGDE